LEIADAILLGGPWIMQLKKPYGPSKKGERPHKARTGHGTTHQGGKGGRQMGEERRRKGTKWRAEHQMGPQPAATQTQIHGKS